VKALEMVGAASPPFDLVVADEIMPQLTGSALAEEIGRISPGLPVLLCTGYRPGQRQETVERTSVARVLAKPIRSHELAAAIREVLDDG
jgi:CheY-like chemotaxis protein